MIYVPPELHRAMKRRGVEEGRPGSDLYVEAARSYLAGDGTPLAEPSAVNVQSLLEQLTGAVQDQGERIEALHRKLDLMRSPRTDDDGPQRMAGTTAASAMRIMLEILTRAGEAGMNTRALRRAMVEEGVTSGATETARAVLRAAGIVGAERGQWFMRRF